MFMCFFVHSFTHFVGNVFFSFCFCFFFHCILYTLPFISNATTCMRVCLCVNVLFGEMVNEYDQHTVKISNEQREYPITSNPFDLNECV